MSNAWKRGNFLDNSQQTRTTWALRLPTFIIASLSQIGSEIDPYDDASNQEYILYGVGYGSFCRLHTLVENHNTLYRFKMCKWYNNAFLK